jgi:AcrR family transcriptional regulator
MRNTSLDRRSQRTRRLLHTALLELMLEQRYDEITVQDIIDRANVGRSTFYAHYLDKQDLLLSEFTRVLDTLSQHIARFEPGEHPPRLALFFRHVQLHHQLYKALVRGGGIDLLFRKGHERLRQNIEQHLRSFIPADRVPAVPPGLVATHIAGAILSMLTWWLDQEMPYTPEQMDAMFQDLVLPGVQRALEVST